MSYKLIVLDMDGTLLSSEKEVSRENQIALQKAIDQGINVAIATGRIFTSARIYAKLLGIATPIIACNGALIREDHSNKVIYRDPLSKEDAIEVARICKRHDLYFHCYDEENFYIEQLAYSSLKYDSWNEKQKEEDRIHIEKVEDLEVYLKNNDIDVLKMVVIDEDNDKLEKVKKELEQIKTIEIDKSWYNNIEIMNKGVSKGKAIEKLSHILNIDKKEIIAFGDNYNDLSMKDYVGTFVAMENGEAYVKAQADYVTASNDDDGVAKGIEALVFNNALKHTSGSGD